MQQSPTVLLSFRTVWDGQTMGIIHADSLPLLVTPERRLRGTRCQRLFAVIIRLRVKLRKCMPGRGAFFRYQQSEAGFCFVSVLSFSLSPTPHHSCSFFFFHFFFFFHLKFQWFDFLFCCFCVVLDGKRRCPCLQFGWRCFTHARQARFSLFTPFRYPHSPAWALT